VSLRVIVVDDEPLAREMIAAQLARWSDLELLHSTGRPREALRLIAADCPDLVFLDIRMPGMSGLEILDTLADARGAADPPFVILVTAFDQHALRAFERHAIDYLLKPFDDERFDRCLRHARERIAASRARDELLTLRSALGGSTRAAGAAPPLRLEVDGRLLVLDPEEVSSVEVADHYLIVSARGTTHLARLPISELEQRLAGRLLRIHRSTLVNPDHVVELASAPQPAVRLRDGRRLPVGRRRLRRVRETLAARRS
jgi:two-component system LytT family response regulator